MASLGAPLEWWELVDRASVIRAGADLGADGGVLVLAGPKGFGHQQAVRLAVRQVGRFGWACHDLSTEGPLNVEHLLISGLEALFPTAPNGVTQAAQLAGMGLSQLVRHVRATSAELTEKHCFVASYADDTAPVMASEVDALVRAAAGPSLCFLLTATHVDTWLASAGVDMVELSGFHIQHIENCLKAGSNRLGVSLVPTTPIDDDLRPMMLPNGTVVPQAAYTWLRRCEVRA